LRKKFLRFITSKIMHFVELIFAFQENKLDFVELSKYSSNKISHKKRTTEIRKRVTIV